MGSLRLGPGTTNLHAVLLRGMGSRSFWWSLLGGSLLTMAALRRIRVSGGSVLGSSPFGKLPFAFFTREGKP